MGRLKDLHQLLHSLDTSERRFIRRFQQGTYDRDSQAGRLLAQLLELSVDEFDQLGPAAFSQTYGKGLPTVTARLRRFVLDLLLLQHGGKTVESRIHLALEEVRWLFYKQHWEEGLRTIRQAQKLAQKFSYSAQALCLLEWERIFIQSTLPTQAQARFLDIRNRETATEELLRNQSELRHLEFIIRDRGRRNLMSQSHLERSEIEAILQTPAVQEGMEAADFLSFSLASMIQGSCYFYLRETEKAQVIFTRLFDAWTERPKWIQEQPRRFIEFVQPLIVTVLYSKAALSRYPEIMDFIQSLHFPHPAHQVALQKTFFQNSILVYMNTARLDEGLVLLKRLSPWLEAKADSLTANTHLMFLYNSAILYFMMARNHSAKQTVRKILAYPIREARTDIRHFARLLECVLNYELGEHELNEYLLLSTYQFFQRHQMSPLQSKTLSLLQSLAKVSSEKEQRTLLDTYLTDLRSLNAEVGKTELWIWAKAKSQSTALKAVYLQLIQEVNQEHISRVSVSLQAPGAENGS